MNKFMFSSAKLSTLLLPVLCFIMLTSVVSAIELPEDVIILEAESAAEMDNGIEFIKDQDASDGIAIDSEVGAKAVHEVDIPKAGEWYLWIRIFCPNGGQDSYWIGMDKADPNPLEDALGENAVRIYSAQGDSVNTNDQPFNIWFWDFGKSHTDPRSFFKVKSAEKHQLWSKGREPGTLLDQILLTMDADFNAEEASGGDAIEIPKAVTLNNKLAVTWGNIKQQ